MIWHIKTLVHPVVIFGGLIVYALRYPIMAAVALFSIQQVLGA
jgi:hypothetical protein